MSQLHHQVKKMFNEMINMKDYFKQVSSLAIYLTCWWHISHSKISRQLKFAFVGRFLYVLTCS